MSLSDLADPGYVARNPGYGHPMRPEYLLTAAGLQIDPACDATYSLLELRETLTVAPPRAVTLGLRSMLDQAWILQPRIAARTESSGYELLRKGRTVLVRIDGLY